MNGDLGSGDMVCQPDSKMTTRNSSFQKRGKMMLLMKLLMYNISLVLSVSSIWSVTVLKHTKCKVFCKALICEDCSRIMKQTVARDTRLVTKRAPNPSLYVNKLLMCRKKRTIWTLLMTFVLFQIQTMV